MAMMMKVEVISRETIKPSSPTPHHLRTFNLSFLDQIAPPSHVPIILFYTPDAKIKTLEQCLLLKNSLPETLTRFYPLAGRIKEDDFIECNDEGVDYFEAKVNGLLSDAIKQPNFDFLKQILPCETYNSGPVSKSEALLAIQVNIFDCGGMAVGVCISHKIADGSSLAAFVNGWSNTAHLASELTHPIFESASLFPQRDLMGFAPNSDKPSEKIVTKRFVFDASIITSLRSKASHISSVDQPKPTRIEALSALIWKCFMDVVRVKEGPIKIYAALQAVNIRGRMVPPLSKDSFGNMATFAKATSTVEIEKECHELVGLLRNAIRTINGEYVRKLQGGEPYFDLVMSVAESVNKGEIEFLILSSWCRLPWYETDFGWGKPIWVTTTNMPAKNVVIFMDTSAGDGIEAYVNMVEEDMVEFERRLDLLAFVPSTQNGSA